MNSIKMFSIALIVAGSPGLIYGGITYTRNTQQARIGPHELPFRAKQTVNMIQAGVVDVGSAKNLSSPMVENDLCGHLHSAGLDSWRQHSGHEDIQYRPIDPGFGSLRRFPHPMTVYACVPPYRPSHGNHIALRLWSF